MGSPELFRSSEVSSLDLSPNDTFKYVLLHIQGSRDGKVVVSGVDGGWVGNGWVGSGWVGGGLVIGW